jgi:hypothetical protein
LLDRYLWALDASLDSMLLQQDFRGRIKDAARHWFRDTLRVLFGGFEPALVSDGMTTAVVPKPILGAIVAGRGLGPGAYRPGQPVLAMELGSFNRYGSHQDAPQLSRLGPFPRPRFHQPHVVREIVQSISHVGVGMGC